MGKRYFRYVVYHYGKNFLILLFGLSLAIVLIDFLQHATQLHGGINRKVLYMYYSWQKMLALIYPLVILFALAWTQITFINRNIFVAFFSFGYTRRQLLKPFFSARSPSIFFLRGFRRPVSPMVMTTRGRSSTEKRTGCGSMTFFSNTTTLLSLSNSSIRSEKSSETL